MIINRLKSIALFLLVVLTTACGGNKQVKDAATTTAEPASQSYPPQNPGNEDASDTLTAPVSASAAPTQPESGSK